MSGGYFNYIQTRLRDEANKLAKRIIERHLDDYSDEIFEILTDGVHATLVAATYLHRIDWLLSGDDGELTCKSRLEAELAEIGDSREVKELKKDNDEQHELIMRQSELLHKIANALYGPPPALTMHDLSQIHDNIQVLKHLECQQSNEIVALRQRVKELTTLLDKALTCP